MLLRQSLVKLIATSAIMTRCEQSSNKTDFSGDKQSAVRIKVGVVKATCLFLVNEKRMRFTLHQNESVTPDTDSCMCKLDKERVGVCKRELVRALIHIQMCLLTF